MTEQVPRNSEAEGREGSAYLHELAKDEPEVSELLCRFLHSRQLLHLIVDRYIIESWRFPNNSNVGLHLTKPRFRNFLLDLNTFSFNYEAFEMNFLLFFFVPQLLSQKKSSSSQIDVRISMHQIYLAGGNVRANH